MSINTECEKCETPLTKGSTVFLILTTVTTFISFIIWPLLVVVPFMWIAQVIMWIAQATKYGTYYCSTCNKSFKKSQLNG